MTSSTGSLAGHSVTRVGYGAMQLTGVSSERADPVLLQALELGVNHVDTAHFYGPDGHVNGLLRAALNPYPDDLVIVTKVGAQRAGDTLVAAQRPEQLRDQVEANLVSLGLERLDVLSGADGADQIPRLAREAALQVSAQR